MKQLGKNIRFEMNKLNISIKEISELLDRPTDQIDQWLNGERVCSFRQLEKVASYLHTTVEYLLREN